MSNKGTKKATFTMQIVDVVIVEKGDTKGSMAITVKATKDGKDYQFPYLVPAAQIKNTSLDSLKLRVMNDVNEIENQRSKENAMIEKLLNMKGKDIKLQ